MTEQNAPLAKVVEVFGGLLPRSCTRTQQAYQEGSGPAAPGSVAGEPKVNSKKKGTSRWKYHAFACGPDIGCSDYVLASKLHVGKHIKADGY